MAVEARGGTRAVERCRCATLVAQSRASRAGGRGRLSRLASRRDVSDSPRRAFEHGLCARLRPRLRRQLRGRHDRSRKRRIRRRSLARDLCRPCTDDVNWRGVESPWLITALGVGLGALAILLAVALARLGTLMRRGNEDVEVKGRLEAIGAQNERLERELRTELARSRPETSQNAKIAREELTGNLSHYAQTLQNQLARSA